MLSIPGGCPKHQAASELHFYFSTNYFTNQALTIRNGVKEKGVTNGIAVSESRIKTTLQPKVHFS